MYLKLAKYTLLVFCISACVQSHPLAIYDSRPDFMNKLRIELQVQGISFTEAADGSFVYQPSDEEKVAALVVQIETQLQSLIKTHFDSISVTKLFTDILKKNDIPYTQEVRADGIWIVWTPKNELQKEQLENQAIESHRLFFQARSRPEQ